jgi:hypothetical protein
MVLSIAIDSTEALKKNFSQNWNIFINSLNSKLKTGEENIYASDDTYTTIRSIIMYCIESILDARLPNTFTGPQDHIPNLIKYVDDLSVSFDNLNADNFIKTFTSVFNDATKEALKKDLNRIKSGIQNILNSTKKDYVSFIKDIRTAIAQIDNVSLIGFDAHSLSVSEPIVEMRMLIKKIIKEEINKYRYY